jgi:hypothetical protein
MSSKVIVGGGGTRCTAAELTSGAIANRRDVLDLLFRDFVGEGALGLVNAASAISRDSFSLCMERSMSACRPLSRRSIRALSI